MILADAEARRRIAEDLGQTFVVEAAAGTGKTTALVGRIVALLRRGARLSRMVAVTFTEKAAGEMKLRLRSAIDDARSGASEHEREHLDAALGELEAARIGTIHSLCADLLRERPVEAAVDPRFELCAQDEQRRFFEAAFDRWFETVLGNPPEGVRRVLRRRHPRAALREAAHALAEHRDFEGGWRRDAFDRNGAIDDIITRIARLTSIPTDQDDYLGRSLAFVGLWYDEICRREAVHGRDYDGLEAGLSELARKRREWGWKGGRSKYKGRPRDEVVAERDAVKSALDDVVAACEADLAACLHKDLQPAIAAYESRKARAGRLDFLDLLLRTRDLLRNPVVLSDLRARFDHLFVDEFQDTDPLQAEILVTLASDGGTVVPGKLFIVGDPKQSIYRFRRADASFYARVVARLRKEGTEVLHLSTSFRSDPRIQDVVNAAFEPVMQGGHQAAYVPLDRFRHADGRRPAVVVLPIPAPYGEYGKVTGIAVDESLPDAVAAWIHWVVEKSRWTVSEPGQPEPVAVQPRHICLLFRRFQAWGRDVTRPYLRGLEARRIPHVLVGGRSFHEREEVAAIRNALTAIEWPDDELAVFAALRGPLFALSDDALLAWRHEHRSLHPFRKPPAIRSELVEVSDALDVLADLHRDRNRRPIADTVTAVLDRTRAHAGLAMWSAGDQVLANALRLVDTARRFEASGTTSFRAFVDVLSDDAERGIAPEAPAVEEGTEGVRLMTVHTAKGLEFPIVVLCDPTAPAVHDDPSHHVDPDARVWAERLCGCVPAELRDHAAEALARENEEAVRLVYVGATRARDVLAIPSVGDGPLEGWFGVLEPAIRPADPAQPRRAKGCPKFGEDSVYVRPEKAPALGPATARPGLHAATAGHEVVWWDPKLIGAGAPEDDGMRAREILIEDQGDLFGEKHVADEYRAWSELRLARLRDGAQPTCPSATVTSLARFSGSLPNVPWQSTAANSAARPTGRRFGTLVHATLAAVPLDADRAEVATMARLQARIIDASDDEIAAAIEAVVEALAHDLLRQAASSIDCRREVSVVSRTADGLVVEGTADLVFRAPDGWVVVDFKTERQPDATHARQVQMLVDGVAAATGEATRGILLGV